MSEQQLQHSEKYTIAWFKLAEFVARKERERAFGIYRLLVHSLSDEALAVQLEGDLLLAFQDERAIESYKKASMLYEAAGKHLQAAAVYEHCLTIDTGNREYARELVRLYAKLSMAPQEARATARLVALLIQQGESDMARQLVDACTLPLSQRALVYEVYIAEILAVRAYPDAELTVFLERTLEHYSTPGSDERLASFLAKLAAVSAEAHVAAVTYLKNGKKVGNATDGE